MEEKELTVIDTPAISDDSLIEIAEKAEKRIDAVNKIKRMALRVTNNRDWIDQNGKPYLQTSGSEKVARLFGISWRIDEPLREDEESGHFIYTYKGYFSMGGITIEAIGTRSSKDGFFKRYDYSKKDENGHSVKTELPPSEIDKSDVKKAAFTNCVGNGITRLLGIRNLTWEELTEAGIKVAGVSKVEYNQAEEGKESKDLRQEIRRMIIEISGDDNAQAKEMLQEFTSFVPKGKTETDRVRGKQRIEDLTEKQLPPTYGKVKATYEEWQKKSPVEAPTTKTPTTGVDFKNESTILDLIGAMDAMATIEACDKLLEQAIKAGLPEYSEGYARIKMARDKRATSLRG